MHQGSENCRPQVSVVVNVLNGGGFIATALASILCQTLADLEVVVWNNGSTDDTEDVVRSFQDPRVRMFSHSLTIPLYEARNLAISKCRGDLIAFLDADDWWRPDKLERQVSRFSAGVGAVYSNFFVVNEIASSTRLYTKRGLPEGQIYSELLRRYRVGLLTLMVRREIFEKYRFDPDLEIIGDFDLVMRLARETEFRCVQEPLAWSRIHGANESERKKRLHLNELSEWCLRGEANGLLTGKDLRNMGRMIRAKKVEVELDSRNFARAAVNFLAVRPIGRQFKVAQRIMTSRRSARRLSKGLDRP